MLEGGGSILLADKKHTCFEDPGLGCVHVHVHVHGLLMLDRSARRGTLGSDQRRFAGGVCAAGEKDKMEGKESKAALDQTWLAQEKPFSIQKRSEFPRIDGVFLSVWLHVCSPVGTFSRSFPGAGATWTQKGCQSLPPVSETATQNNLSHNCRLTYFFSRSLSFKRPCVIIHA